jgi:hypothetical protein
MGASTDYYYNESWQVLEEREDGSEEASVQWLWDARYIDAPVLRWRDADGDPETGDNGLEETVYFCNDANMNITALVDATPGSATDGEVVERYAYAAYGRAAGKEEAGRRGVRIGAAR